MTPVRPLTGQDEIAFHEPGGGPHGRLVALAAAVAGHSQDTLAALPLAAWEERLLHLRGMLIGPVIEAEADCTACGTGNSLVFSASDLPREPVVPPALDGTALRALRPADLIALEERSLQGEPALALLLAAASGMDEADAAMRLEGPDRDAVIAALESAASGLGIEIGSACTACGAAMVLPLDVATFVDGELRNRATRLMDEVHLIATAYHWSEDGILSLPFARRQGYLRRILDTQTSGPDGFPAEVI